MSDDELTPEKIAAAIERLEAEKRRRSEGKPAAPVYINVERTLADPTSNRIINRPAPRAKPKRKAKKAQEARLTPVPFFTQTGKPTASDPGGSTAQGWSVVKGKELALCDAAGVPAEWHPLGERRPLRTAQHLLKQRLAARRGTGPDHRPIVYPKLGLA